MLADDIYHYYKMINGKRHQAGRFLVNDGHVRHLEDYYNDMDVPEGAIDNYTIAKLARPNPGAKFASEGAMLQGKHLDLIPEAELNKPIPPPVDVTPEMIQQHLQKLPPPVWSYRRAGHDVAHTLEHHGQGNYSLDGNPLAQDELQTIALNLKNKSATLRYKSDGVADTIAKMESVFTSLAKADEMDPAEAFKHLGAAAEAGHIPPEAIASLRRRVYEDHMLPGVGNKFAFQEHRAKGDRPGVYASMDANDFKSINDLYGHDMGDHAIKAMGTAAREAMDEAVGSEHGKLFRNGGDEFVAHVPTHEHAALFARKLRDKLDAIPAIAGQHKLSMSFGLGNDFGTADKALYHAKDQKYAMGPEGAPRSRLFPHGQTPSLAHSLVPGFEGPIPLQQPTLPKIDLPEGAKVEPPKPEEGQLLHTPTLPEPTKTA